MLLQVLFQARYCLSFGCAKKSWAVIWPSRRLPRSCRRTRNWCTCMYLYSISECHDVRIGELWNVSCWRYPLSWIVRTMSYAKITPVPKAFREWNSTFWIWKKEKVAKNRIVIVQLCRDKIATGWRNQWSLRRRTWVFQHARKDSRTLRRQSLSGRWRWQYCSPRLYQTGDLGRRVFTGSKELEIVGQCDFMVKIDSGIFRRFGRCRNGIGQTPKNIERRRFCGRRRVRIERQETRDLRSSSLCGMTRHRPRAFDNF